MRKGIAGLPIKTVVEIAAVLIGAVVVFILWGSTAGKGDAQVKSVSDAFDALAEFNCKNINDMGAGDTDKTSATFGEFMAAMKEVYDNCNAAGSSCSGKDVCRTMTLDLGTKGMGADGKGDGTYKEIIITELEKAKLNVFVNYLVDVLGGVGAMGSNIYCERENADWNDYEIDAYYSGGTYTRVPGLLGEVLLIKAGDVSVCDQVDWSAYKDGKSGLFAVADGSKVTIKATKPDEWGGSVDLKVTVNGGKYTTLEPPVVTPTPTCTTDANCNAAPNPPWRYCNEKNTPKTCEYYGYCKNRPSDTTRCKPEVTLTCTLGSSCTDTANPSLEYACANGLKIKTINKLETGSDGQPRLIFGVEDSSKAGGIRVLKVGEERWFKSSIVGAVNAEPKDAKMSVAVTEIEYHDDVKKYEVKLLQGCY